MTGYRPRRAACTGDNQKVGRVARETVNGRGDDNIAGGELLHHKVGKIVDDALPFEPAAAGRETVEELLAQDQGEKGAEDVAATRLVPLHRDYKSLTVFG
ncbi:MAG: hypothetical protein WB611_25145 [Stellaceae bacterium]